MYSQTARPAVIVYVLANTAKHPTEFASPDLTFYFIYIGFCIKAYGEMWGLQARGSGNGNTHVKYIKHRWHISKRKITLTKSKLERASKLFRIGSRTCVKVK